MTTYPLARKTIPLRNDTAKLIAFPFLENDDSPVPAPAEEDDGEIVVVPFSSFLSCSGRTNTGSTLEPLTVPTLEVLNSFSLLSLNSKESLVILC